MDYLDSSIFEQMARDYNKKYGGIGGEVSALENKNVIFFNGTRQVFVKMLKLLNSLKNTFKRYNQFSKFFEDAENIKQSLRDFFENNFNEELKEDFEVNQKPANHKFCALTMLEAYIEVFKLNIEVLGEVDRLKNILLLNGNNFDDNQEKQELEYLVSKLYELQDLFKTFTEILKEFYSKIN